MNSCSHSLQTSCCFLYGLIYTSFFWFYNLLPLQNAYKSVQRGIRFETSEVKIVNMDTNASLKRTENTVWDFILLLAGVGLLCYVSHEIIAGNRQLFSKGFLIAQFCFCMIFVADYIVRSLSDRTGRYALRHIPYLLISLPYLNIIALCGVALDRSWMMFLGVIPLLRTLIASYVVVRWFAEKGVRRIFTAYALTVVLLTYLSALVFYDYEIGVNAHLHGFGNAVWWAFMSMTTVGAAIFPVTAVGKVLAVILPCLGMLMLPLFTVYVADLYKDRR